MKEGFVKDLPWDAVLMGSVVGTVYLFINKNFL